MLLPDGATGVVVVVVELALPVVPEDVLLPGIGVLPGLLEGGVLPEGSVLVVELPDGVVIVVELPPDGVVVVVLLVPEVVPLPPRLQALRARAAATARVKAVSREKRGDWVMSGCP